MCGVLDIDAKGRETYWIGPNVTVLTFIGNPYSLDLKPIKLVTYKKQRITLFHKNSGPGIYAFLLPDLIVLGIDNKRTKVKTNGYFLVKKKQISKTYWLKKTSMKYKTKKIYEPKPKSEYDFQFRNVPESEDSIIIW